MAKINLLPWRDRLREKSKKEFIQTSGLVAVGGIFIVIIWSMMLGLQIDRQTERNGVLKAEITKLEKDIEEVESLKKKRTMLIERIKVIQGLQSGRPVVVRLFDELVRTLPDGVYYTSVVRKANLVSLKGVAETNEGVSALMRKLEASNSFVTPVLSDVTEQKSKNKDKTEIKSSAFSMQVAEEAVAPSAASATKAKGAVK